MRDIVVVGTSAGGVTALQHLAKSLPHSFPAALIVAMHRSSSSYLVELLSKGVSFPVQWARDQMPICREHLYISPPDKQLVVEHGHFRVDNSPKEGLHRPSINLLFRSAAAEYGRRVIGVILSGCLNDGTAGLWSIKRRGGIAVVQDPNDAEFPDMPLAATRNVSVDFVLPLEQIADKLVELTQETEEADPPERSARVLIVEDEAIAASALEERLLDLGYEVSGSACSGADALSFVHTSTPDLVLMDIRLEGPMDGIEAARQIWERFQIPIVYVTAFADANTLDNVNSGECYGFIAKPFHSNTVRAAIELALKRRKKERLAL